MSAENTVDAAGREPGSSALPDRASVLALAAGLRASLRLHQQLGLQQYPLTPGLREFLSTKRAPPVARRRPPAPAVAAPQAKKPAAVKAMQPTAASSDQLSLLQRDLAECGLCSLAAARRGMVMGRGVAGARLLIVGDFSRQEPDFAATTLFGAAEDAMLGNMVRAMGLAPEDVYVTNAVKCCPLGDQPPAAESVQACQGHLRREIALVQPQVILAMGDAAARAVLGAVEPVSRLRGRWRRTAFADASGGNLEVMVTFHPAYLLAQPDMKKAVWTDLQTIQRRLATPEAGSSKKKL